MTLSSSSSFPTTHWTLIVSASSGSCPERNAALLELCQDYWSPVHAFICLRGHSKQAAQDLTQSFFVHVLEDSVFESASSERGRFRNYLLVSLKNFLANEWEREQAQRRGGGRKFVPFDIEQADAIYAQHSQASETPETAFDRQYALTVIERAIGKLKDTMVCEGKAEHFLLLQPYLTDDGTETPYVGLADKLGTTEGALRVSLHRLRRRCRDFIRAEVAHLVSSPSEIDGELRYLLRSLSI